MFELDTIYCGDCAEVMREWPDECVDLVITSPPYDNLRSYNGYKFEFESIARQLYRVVKVGGVIVWVVSDATIDGSETGTSFRQVLYFKEMGFNLHDTMIWEKSAWISGSGRYNQSFEYMFILSRGAPISVNLIKDRTNITGSQPRPGDLRRHKDGTLKPRGDYIQKEIGFRENIWYIPVGNNISTKDIIADGHPGTFPESLAKDHILSWSNAGDVVLDPMCGSGTTLKMAKELGRHWVGIDISADYCAMSQKRVDGAKVPLPGFTS